MYRTLNGNLKKFLLPEVKVIIRHLSKVTCISNISTSFSTKATSSTEAKFCYRAFKGRRMNGCLALITQCPRYRIRLFIVKS